MSETSLQQAAAKARQAEIVLQLLSQYPSSLDGDEMEASTLLLKSLVGNAAAYLANEQVKQELGYV